MLRRLGGILVIVRYLRDRDHRHQQQAQHGHEPPRSLIGYGLSGQSHESY
jgi:hypothetical protein